MDVTPLVRLRWRLRGAWLWPSWVVLSIADAVIHHDLPITGERGSLVGGWLMGAVLSLVGIVLFGGLLGRLVRRVSPDMPRVVARNYGGAIATLAVTLALLAGGLIHQGAVEADHAALRQATARATAYIETHAPVQFRHNLQGLSVYPVEQSLSYRVCATDVAGTRDYCVVVDLWQPRARSVHQSGSEPNSVISQGTG